MNAGMAGHAVEADGHIGLLNPYRVYQEYTRFK